VHPGALAPNGVAPAAPPVRPGSPLVPAGREQPIEPPPEASGASLLSQASRALAGGATTRALDLAHRATVATPASADAWLTLGAAYAASGNASAARDAYRTCVARAKTPNVSECRMLARP
jgi:hypothetical protein